MSIAELRAPAHPIGPSPLRRPRSIRRTASIDTSWPDGLGKPMRMQGHARDLVTLEDAASTRLLAEDRIDVLASPRREIISLHASRADAEAQGLIGARGGGYLRAEIARVLPDELAEGSPLYLLLDDLSGASLVAGWAWSRWNDDWMARLGEGRKTSGRNGDMRGVCAGFRPGSSALMEDGSSNPALQSSARVAPLPHPDDPDGWHVLAGQEGVGMRRARRLDVWLDDVLRIDVGFQDSATSPSGDGRIAVHEYHVAATADPDSFELLSLKVDPRVLPYGECPAASPNSAMMIGERLGELRSAAPVMLHGVLGCTHLNDVLRSMSDVPALTKALWTALAG